ncbi:c-type cytochrome [Burkholderia ubonensis]|uniref:c-type cytochrome n=1 Tax=Burkholderia ubonensis TaxID=101571 RepID=UPI0007555273|nr:cytochrome c [Burkholderia ubonensis]KWB75318.1 cytochrome C [Burkholderia ubonensis]
MTNRGQYDPMHARENAEPGERANPVPWLLGLVAASLTAWGVSYFLLAKDPAVDAASVDADKTATQSATAGAAPDGTQIFASRCASCHQVSGQGLPGVFPPLAGSEWVNGDAKVFARILLLGVNGNLSVKGATFNGTMPAFGSMSDDEIAAVGTHVRASFGNKSAVLTADIVKAERDKLGGRTTPWAGGDELKMQK